MQFRDLKKQYENLRPEIDAQIAEVVNNTNFISGTKVNELERQLADYVGVKHCVTCGNGTDALSLALMVWKIGKGDAVFVPDFTFFASAEVVAYSGATPIFIDVDSDTYNIDVNDLEKKIKVVIEEKKLNPKVIMAVDLFGQPADYDRLKKVAEKYDIKILEDSAQGFGGSIENKMAGSFGDIATTSFFPAKPLGCYGDGGAIFTNNDEWAEELSSLRIHGKGKEKYDNIRIGVNSRLDTIQAAILIPKLKAFIDYECNAVNEVARKYNEKLREIVKIPKVIKGFNSSWAQYTIQAKNQEERDSLKTYLSDNQIPSMIYYPKAMHMQKALENYDIEKYLCPVSEKLCEIVLSIPIHPYLTNEEQQQIVDKIEEFYKES